MATRWNPFTNQIDISSEGGDGTVVGPGVATPNAVVRFNGSSGNLLKNSSTTLSDANVLSTGTLNLSTALEVAYGGTGASSFTSGAYILGNGASALQVVDGTSKGSIPAGDGTTISILSVGSDGQVLQADSGEASGIKWATVAGTGDVTASSNLADNTLIRGDGGAKGIQDSGITIDDSNNLSGVASVDVDSGGDYQINSASVLSSTTLGSSVVSSSLTSVGTIGTGTWEATDVGVAYGGTGRSSHTAYAVLCGGTTSTGAQQSVSGLGSSGQVLTSAGAGALPTWETVSGTGDVTSASNITDHSIVRGDGGAKGVQDSGVLIDDSDNLSGVGTLALAGDVTDYVATNDGNPQIRLGATDAEELHIQAVYDSGAQTLDYVLFQTDVASATADKGLYRFNVDGTNILDIDDGGLELTGSITISGTVDGRDIATDGTKLDTIEDNADVTDATNVIAALDGATISSATVATGDKVLIQDVDDTDSLKYVTAQSIADLSPQGDVTAASSLTDHAVVRGDGGAKGVQTSSVLIDDSNNVSGVGTLAIGGNLTAYEATNDGNPEIRLGAADAEELHLQAVYDSGAQTLDYVLFQTDAASATANKGLYRFNVDGTDILDIDDGGIDLDSGMALSIAGTDVLSATTLGSGVTGSSLTSVGTIATGTWEATDVGAAHGGTGRSSHTAYAVICGGTTTTGAQQSVSGLGTSGQVLTSAGAGALPTWEDATGGSGDVTSSANITDHSIVRGDGGAKGVQESGILIDDSDNVSGVTTLSLDGQYINIAYAVNDGNPFLRMGQGAQIFQIETLYESGTQYVESVRFSTATSASPPNEGRYEFYVDGVHKASILDSGYDLESGLAYSINETSVLNATTLGSGVTASSLTSVGTIATGTWEATDVGVAHGGTGRSSHTAYAVLCGGTTTTGAQQSVSGLGSSGQVLTSAGAGALPTWSDAGSGDVQKVGTPADSQIGVWTGDGTIEGTAGFTWDASDLTMYEAVNDGNPQIRLGATDAEELHIQAVYDSGAQTLDYVLFQTDAASATADKGLFRFNVDGTNILDIDDGGLELTGSITVSGTVDGRDIATDGTKLDGIETGADVTDETNVVAALDGATISSATVATGDKVLIQDVDDSDNLKYVTAQSIADLGNAGDVTSSSNITDHTIVRGDGGAKGVQDSGITVDDSDNVSGIGTLSLAGNITDYEAVNDGNPEIRLGATDAEELHIQAVYDSGAQTLDYVLFQTDAASATADKGLYRFNVDGTDILDIDDGGLELTGSITVSGTVDGRDIATDGTKLDTIEDNADVTDETNVIAALDGATISAATVATGDKVLIQDVDDTDSLKYVTAQSIADLATGGGDVSKVGTPVDGQIGVWTGDGTIEGDASLTFDTSDDTLVIAASGKLAFGAVDILSDSSGTMTLSNIDAIDSTTESTLETAIDSLTNLTAVGTIATGTWEATDVGAAHGGTGRSSHTAYAVICGGTTTTGAQQSVSGLGTSGQVLTSAGAGALPTWEDAAGGGSMPAKEYWFAAESLQPLETNFAPIDKLAGSNVNVLIRAFDDTTEEYVNGKIQVPGDVDTSGTVTFRAYVSAATAAASKNIAMTFGHLALNDGEDWDPSTPYTEEDSGDKAISATQDDVTEITWSETITNLGWAANDLVLFRVSRDPGATDNLSGDMYLFSLAIEIPRA